MSSGSKSDFAVFAHSAMPRLRQIAYGWCRDWWQADDAVQATLERVMRRWPTLKDQEAAFAYTRTALVNHMVSESRRAWRQREIPHGDNLPDRAAPPSTQFEQDGLLSLVADLPRRQRAVIILRYVADLFVEETAHILCCSTGTVKSQAFDGRQQLATRLGKTSPVSGAEGKGNHG
jgi:RNA polymerase sigma factor (sigma-70 family)